MRHSGIELLRIIAIFLILVSHVINMVIGAPDITDLQSNPVSSITIISFNSISIVCVNVFVIISGWFGIRFSVKGLLKLTFQCFFFFLIETILGIILLDPFSITQFCKGLVSSFFPGWFISAYIILYILSPIINNHIASNSRKECNLILIPCLFFMFVYGWLFPSSSGNQSTFESGYSAVFLFILYYSVRYYRKFYDKTDVNAVKNGYLLLGYVCTTLLDLFFWILFTFFNISYLSSIIFLYTSPIIILQSFYFFKLFQRLSFKSNIINKLSASSLSIMLFHFSYGGVIFKEVINDIYIRYSNIFCLFLIFLFLIFISFSAILLDQIRIIIWNKINKRFAYKFGGVI